MVLMDATALDWEQRIGSQVRSARITADLTQAELARRANLSETSVRNLEQGSGSTLKTLVAIARVLDRTAWLEEFDPQPDGPSPIELLRRSRSKPSRPQRVRRAGR
jgi:transcriptional regulator with XRE-family HTH domain